MAGRKPLGVALVERLAGSEQAKDRLEAVLSTIAGQRAVTDAAARLGISEAMFHKLRSRVLRVCLDELEPKQPGRRPVLTPAEQQQIATLEAQVESLQAELSTMEVRLELAQVLPQVLRPEPAVKKTTPLSSFHRRNRPR